MASHLYHLQRTYWDSLLADANFHQGICRLSLLKMRDFTCEDQLHQTFLLNWYFEPYHPKVTCQTTTYSSSLLFVMLYEACLRDCLVAIYTPWRIQRNQRNEMNYSNPSHQLTSLKQVCLLLLLCLPWASAFPQMTLTLSQMTEIQLSLRQVWLTLTC